MRYTNKTILALSVAFVSGCISVERHEREIAVAVHRERNENIRWAEEVQKGEISADELVWLLKGKVGP